MPNQKKRSRLALAFFSVRLRRQQRLDSEAARMATPPNVRAFGRVLALMGASCVGQIGGQSPAPTDLEGAGAPGPDLVPGITRDMAATAGARRLTQREYDDTIRALF